MTDYRVNLDIFAGPLDLLLYLVHKEEVDIYDIPIAKITNQYITYIEMLKSLNVDLAGDFLVMAATLMQLKSAMLLPKEDPEHFEDENLLDPRSQLIQQLLEYKKFKDAANLLDAAAREQNCRFPRPSIVVDKLEPKAEPEIDIDQISIWNLLEAFDSIMQATGSMPDISHITDDTPIDLYQIEILSRLQTEGSMTFERIFESAPNRLVMIGLFLALLELVRNKLIWVDQEKQSKSLFLKSLTDEPAEQAVQKAILAVEAENQKSVPAEQAPAKSSPIQIIELSSKEKSIANPDYQTHQACPIPIAELPPAASLPTTKDETLDEIEIAENSSRITE